MKLIEQNPYRILGLPVSATDKAIIQRIDELKLYSKMGKEIKFDSDNYLASKINRDIESIDSARQKLDQSNNKLFYSMFWFWNTTSNVTDRMAFQELSEGHTEKAIEFWLKDTDKNISNTNYSSFKNLSLMYMYQSTESDKFKKDIFLNGLSLSCEFIKYSEGVTNFANAVLNNRINFDINDSIVDCVDQIIQFVGPHIAKRKSQFKITNKELFTTISPISTVIDINNKFIGKHKQRIQTLVEESKKKREDSPTTANKTGLKLFKDSKESLDEMKAILSKTDLEFQLVNDTLAEEILQCSIDYFNHYRETSTDPSKDAMKLLNCAKDLAVGKKLKDRIDNSYPIIKEFSESKEERDKIRPVKENIDKVSSHLDNFANKAAQYNYIKPEDIGLFLRRTRAELNKIKKHTGVKNDIFSVISNNVAVAGLNAINTYVSVMFTAAGDASRFLGERIRNEIEPLYDIIGTIDMTQSNRKGYEDSCKQIGFYPSTPTGNGRSKPRLVGPKKTGSNGGGGNGCYIATMAYGDYNAPEVLVLRNFRDDILLKSSFGKLFVRSYYRYSPYFVEKLKTKKRINCLIRGLLNIIVRKLK